MVINKIKTKEAPGAIGPYSQGVIAGDMVFCSGQIGIDPENGEMIKGIEKQTEQVLDNLQAVLQSAGCSLNNIVKTTVYLANMDDFVKMNEIYAKKFGEHKPARATVEVAKLPKDALVEIEAIAIL